MSANDLNMFNSDIYSRLFEILTQGCNYNSGLMVCFPVKLQMNAG